MLRISTSTVYDQNQMQFNMQQTLLMHTQLQVSSGRRMVTPADDPAAAARVLEITQSDSMNTQYATNRTSATNSLSLVDGAFQNISNLLQTMRQSATAAGNGVLTNAERQAMASDLNAQLQDLIGQANSTDGAGNYLFSGFQGTTKPFTQTAAGVAYNGDDGQRMVQVAASRQMAMTDPGSDLFMRVKTGNGTFTAQAAPANTGGGVISTGVVTNPALWNGANYSVAFTVAAGVTSYTVTQTSAPAGVVVPATPFVSGQAIAFNGIQFDVKGAPANGDTFTVAPSSNQSIFQTVQNLVNVLNQPVTAGVASSSAQLQQGVQDALNGIDNALNQVLTSRASIGSRMNELDALKAGGNLMGLQYQQSLSTLQDLDYAKAISDLNRQQMTLQAAQKSFVQVAGLTLFAYM